MVEHAHIMQTWPPSAGSCRQERCKTILKHAHQVSTLLRNVITEESTFRKDPSSSCISSARRETTLCEGHLPN
eukprot:15435-Eustigmatos_ZCMA.PRE.1